MPAGLTSYAFDGLAIHLWGLKTPFGQSRAGSAPTHERVGSRNTQKFLSADRGKDVENPSARLMPVRSQVGVARPPIAPAIGRQAFVGAFMVQATQRQLLEIVAATIALLVAPPVAPALLFCPCLTALSTFSDRRQPRRRQTPIGPLRGSTRQWPTTRAARMPAARACRARARRPARSTIGRDFGRSSPGR